MIRVISIAAMRPYVVFDIPLAWLNLSLRVTLLCDWDHKLARVPIYLWSVTMQRVRWYMIDQVFKWALNYLEREKQIRRPVVQDQNDILLKVTSNAICGSYLHIYSGDRVAVSFPIACCGCYICEHDLPVACEIASPITMAPTRYPYRKDGALFGYTDLYDG